MEQPGNKMKTLRPSGTPTIRIIAILFATALLLLDCSRRKDSVKEEYTCPMHPSVVSEKAGSCPVCGMSLVKKHHAEKPGSAANVPEPATTLRTILPSAGVDSVHSSADGVISSDDRLVATISARSAGRIEKLYLTSDLQFVAAGTRVAEIYSPDLLTAQREFLLVLKSDNENAGLISKSKEKLGLLGISDTQISALISSGVPFYSLPISSPVSGYVRQHGPGRIREGEYVGAGDALFDIGSTSSVWADFLVRPDEMAYFKLHEALLIRAGDTVIRARVDFIQPYISQEAPGKTEEASFVKIRAYLPNPGLRLRPGQMITGDVSVPLKGVLILPSAASLDLGLRRVVFIKKNNGFHARTIVAHEVYNGLLEITGGLSLTDSVAAEAGFVMDADSFVHVN